MNQPEVAHILAKLSAAWPRTELGDDSMLLWAEATEDIDVKVASRAADVIIKTEEFFPSIAKFRAVASAHRHRDTTQALPSEPTSAEINKAGFAAVRKILKAHAGGTNDLRGHDHKRGAENCPVCGKYFNETP